MNKRPLSDPLLGSLVAGRYHIVERLSQGGMGAIYIATQEPLGRRVALKVLLEEFTSDEIALGRFEKEAKAVSRLVHPHIVTLFDFGRTETGAMYIAMELLVGRNLRELLDDVGPLPWRRSVHIMKGVVRGLEEAHRHRVIHRDLKPENIVLVRTGDDEDFPKVLDFGLARTIDASPHADRLTQANMIPGTPAYISPERVNGVNDDPRSDLYALGAIWFELLTSDPPFMRQTAVKTIVAHLQDPIPSLRERMPDADRPRAVDDLVAALLAKAPEDRPSDARQLLRLLDSLDSDEEWAALSPGEPGTPAPIALGDWSDSLPDGDLAFFAATEEGEAYGASAPPLGADEQSDQPIALTRRKTPVPLVEKVPAKLTDIADDDTIIPLTKRKDTLPPGALPAIASEPPRPAAVPAPVDLPPPGPKKPE